MGLICKNEFLGAYSRGGRQESMHCARKFFRARAKPYARILRNLLVKRAKFSDFVVLCTKFQAKCAHFKCASFNSANYLPRPKYKLSSLGRGGFLEDLR